MQIKPFIRLTLQILLIIHYILLLSSCGIYKKVDPNTPVTGEERAIKNVQEGRGFSLSNMGNKSTNYEFSSSNPMWRATLEILDFLPLSTVDYSGGIIITDWYNDSSDSNTSLKITVRFLSNEIGSNNIKIIVHQKKCDASNICQTREINSKVKNELLVQILKNASILEKKNIKK